MFSDSGRIVVMSQTNRSFDGPVFPDVPYAKPVGEVVLGFAMESLGLALGPRLPELLGDWFAKHPKIDIVPAYFMPQEFEIQAVPPQIDLPLLQAVGELPTRYWLTSDDDVFAVQVQNDYLALNWRRRPELSYISYEALRDRFIEIARTIETGLARYSLQLRPTRAELTYVNLIEPGPFWSQPADAEKLFKVQIGRSHEAEMIQHAYASSIREDHGWLGRLHVAMLTGFDQVSKEYRLTLNLTGRSKELDERSVEQAVTFMDRAHVAANDAFRALLTVEAKRIWGMT